MGEGASVPEAMSSGMRLCICGGYGRKVTRLTLGDLSTCLVLGRSRGRLMGGQKSAEGDKERRTAPRPERKILDRCHDLAHRRRRSHVG